MADGAPALTADGTETVWRCVECGAPMVPQHARHKTCSERCRWRRQDRRRSPAAKANAYARRAMWQELNASYHRARARLAKAKRLTPETQAGIEALKGRGRVDRAEVDAMLDALLRPLPADAWGDPSPEHDGPLCTALALMMPARRSLDHFTARLLHGALSTRLRIEHEPRRNAFSLVLPTRERCGWVVCLDPRVAALTTALVPLGAAHFLVEIGARARLRPPAPIAPGGYRVRVTTESPLALANGTLGYPVPQRDPKTLVTQLEAVAHRLRIPSPRIEARVIRHELAPVDVRVGGHIQLGPVRGEVHASWGHLDVECNAPGAWLLRCAALVGLGAKTAFGFGRIRVEDA